MHDGSSAIWECDSVSKNIQVGVPVVVAILRLTSTGWLKFVGIGVRHFDFGEEEKEGEACCKGNNNNW